MIGTRIGVALAAAMLASLLAASGANAQAYPTRTVKIVSPFPPGGPTEFVQRLIADRLQATLGQPFVIENRSGGAGGTVGAKSVATAEPDGYTLLFSSPGPLVTAAAIYRKLDYDPVKSFAPIAMTLMAPQMLVVHPSVPAKTMAGACRLCQSTAGRSEIRLVRLRHAAAHAGRDAAAGGGHRHRPRALSRRRAIRHRRHGRSGADDLRSNLGADVPCAVRPLARAGDLHGGTIEAVARYSDHQRGGLSDTAGELLVRLSAPAGTPDAIIGKLNATINDILRSPEAQTGLARLNAEARIGSPQDFARFIAAETPRWAQIAKAANIRID